MLQETRRVKGDKEGSCDFENGVFQAFLGW